MRFPKQRNKGSNLVEVYFHRKTSNKNPQGTGPGRPDGGLRGWLGGRSQEIPALCLENKIHIDLEEIPIDIMAIAPPSTGEISMYFRCILVTWSEKKPWPSDSQRDFISSSTLREKTIGCEKSTGSTRCFGTRLWRVSSWHVLLLLCRNWQSGKTRKAVGTSFSIVGSFWGPFWLANKETDV